MIQPTSFKARWRQIVDVARQRLAARDFPPEQIIEAVTTAPLDWIGRSIPSARSVVAVPDDQH